jgi:hypothetical protein
MRKLKGRTEKEIRSNLEKSKEKLFKAMERFDEIRNDMEEDIESGKSKSDGLVENFYIFMATRALGACGEAHADFEIALEMDPSGESERRERRELVNEAVNVLLDCDKLGFPGRMTEKAKKDFEVFQEGWNAKARESRRIMKIEEFAESGGNEEEEIEFAKPGTVISEDDDE